VCYFFFMNIWKCFLQLCCNRWSIYAHANCVSVSARMQALCYVSGRALTHSLWNDPCEFLQPSAVLRYIAWTCHRDRIFLDRTRHYWNFQSEKAPPTVFLNQWGVTASWVECWSWIYDRQSVGQSVFVSGTHLGPSINFSFSFRFPSDSCGFVIL
jgi:hypothetical protein